MGSIRNIIFDLGGVLIDWNPRYVYDDNYFDTPDDHRYFFEHVASFEWNEEQDAGKSLTQATEERIALFPDWERPLRDFYGRWREMLGGTIEESVEIFRALKSNENYSFYALSNWSAETFPVALDRFDFLEWFDGRLISGHEKLVKPDPAFYQLLTHRFGVEPSISLFIDDNKRNLIAAGEMGFQTIHFESPGQLRSELVERNLLGL